MKELEVVCAVIIDAEARVLICQRAEGKAQAGFWEFPGGKVEADETPEAALQRELLEELGCHCEVHEEWSTVRHDYPDFRIRLRPFRCSLSQGSPEPRVLEHAAMRWVKPEDLCHHELAAADRPVAEEVKLSVR